MLDCRCCILKRFNIVSEVANVQTHLQEDNYIETELGEFWSEKETFSKHLGDNKREILLFFNLSWSRRLLEHHLRQSFIKIQRTRLPMKTKLYR